MPGLHRRQYERLFAWFGSPCRRLTNFQRYLDRTGLGDARLNAQLHAAIDAVHTLIITCHYRSCDGKVAGADAAADDDSGEKAGVDGTGPGRP